MDTNNIDTISTGSSNNCSICLVSLKDNTYTLKCNHTFHYSCLELWLNTNNTCPLCRAIINTHNKKIFLPDNQSNMTPHIVVNINHINNINPINNIINNCNNIKKKILIKLGILSIMFNICALIYFSLTILSNNYKIGKIITFQNDTDPNSIDGYPYDGGVLLLLNIMYIILHIILNVCIYKYSSALAHPSSNPVFTIVICFCIFLLNSFSELNKSSSNFTQFSRPSS